MSFDEFVSYGSKLVSEILKSIGRILRDRLPIKWKHKSVEAISRHIELIINQSPYVIDALSAELIKRIVRSKSNDILKDESLTSELLELIAKYHSENFGAILTKIDPAFEHRVLSYSQEGEDLILDRLLEGQKAGFYIDIGAHHPFRFSNTYLLYRRGWRGINIDATPGILEAFNAYRPGDINIEAFIGDPGKRLNLIMYNEPALNSASKRVIAERELLGDKYWPIGTREIQPIRLADILSQHLPPGQPIDVLNIDVEGAEEEVLRSNDWSRFSPKIIMVEQLATDVQASLDHVTTNFLRQRGYVLIAKAYNTAFFQLEVDHR